MQVLAQELASLAEKGVPNAAQSSAILYIATKSPDRAIEVLRKTVDQQTTDPAPALLLARAQYLAGRREEARQTLVRLRERFPENSIVNTSLIDLDLQSGQVNQALEVARKIKAAEPAQGALLEANVLARADRKDEAVTVLQTALVEQPLPILARELFRNRWQAGRHDEAIQGMQAWLDDHPDDALAYTTLSDAFIQREERARALALLEQAVQLVPNEPRILNNLAWLRNELDRPGAVEAARQAYALAAGSPEIADTLGWILVQKGNIDEGLPLLREAEQGMSDNPEIRYHLAYALEGSGKTDEARRLLREVIDSQATFTGRTDAQRLLLKLQGS
jgi:Flp pilus assembly protein TadD